MSGPETILYLAGLPIWQFVPDVWQLGRGEEPARVAIVGCGGAGCNILRNVIAPANAICIAMNDAVVPSITDIPARLIVRAAPLQGYAAMDEKAVPNLETDEEKDISAALLDRDVALIVGGLGGQLGGWGMSLVGRVARILGDATLALATIPFGLEGPIRRQAAEAQLRLLQNRTDGVVTFGNDQLLRVAKDRPMAKALAALGVIMARPASDLAAALVRSDIPPLRRMLRGAREWRYGMGAGREKHRCFVAVEEAYGSPWFTSLPEEVNHAIVLMSVQEPRTDEEEILHEVQRRSPKASVAWSSFPPIERDDRVVVQIFAGV
jgi:cell division protein FtsZ